MGAKYTEAQAKTTREYLKKFDEFKIRIPKGEKNEWAKIARLENKSLNKFIVDCVEKLIVKK